MGKRYFIALAFFGAFFTQILAQDKKVDMAVLIEEQFANAAVQYKLLEKNVPDTMMPKTLNKLTGKVQNGGAVVFSQAVCCIFLSIHRIRKFFGLRRSVWRFRKRKSITPVIMIWAL
jgi:hypothetical protein